MTKLKKLQPKVTDLPKKKNDQSAVGKIVKKKAATLTQKKKETIVQNVISKKDELVDKAALKKGKNKVKSNLKEEKQKPTEAKKSKTAPKLVPVPKEQKPEPAIVSKKGKNKEKPAKAVNLKEKKVKATVIAKKASVAVPKEEKSKSKVLSKKNKNQSKQMLVPEEVISKVLTKKEKTNLKKVLVPREEKNVIEAISKKKKNKAKVNEPAKEEKVESKTISRKSKRKAKSVLQKENKRPKVALKKTKVTKDVNKKTKKVVVEEPVLEKAGKVSKKKKKLGKNSLNKKNLEKYVKALLKVVDTGEQKRRTLLDMEKPPIFLMITCVKVPKAPLHQIRLNLPHSLVGPNDDIGLFVKDLKRGRRIGPDATIQHYEDLLEKHKIKKIKTIIPINQVKTDYRQFEMRRRLLNSCDHFLCDGRISGHLAHLLGKTFRKNRKLPTSVHMDKKDLKEEFDRALNKTSLQIHSTGDTYVTQFATCSMSLSEITDNLLSITQDLNKNFPGGWDNIRSLRIKSPLSLAIPIYMSLKNKNDVKTPVVEPKRPKAYKSVEGELSTFTSNVRVTVAPDGTVDVLNLGGDSDNDENPEDLEDETEEAPEKEIKEEEEDDDEDDDKEENDDEDEDNEEDEKDDDDEDESDG